MIPGIVAQAAPGTAAPSGDGVVELLLGFNGADGAQNIRDEGVRSRPINFAGNAALTTAQAKFGVSSCTFDGTNDSVNVAPGDGLLFADGPFTVDFWVRRTGSSGVRHLVGERYSATNIGWAITLLTGNTIEVLMTADGSTGSAITGAINVPLNTWTHIAVDRDLLGKVRLYVNGVLDGSMTFNSVIYTQRQGVCIGTQFDKGGDFAGQIDELRIIKGEAFWGDDGGFAVPTVAYPRPAQDLIPADDANFASVLFLLGADGTPGSTRFIDDSSYHRVNGLDGVGNIISTAKFGVFEEEALRLPGTSLMQYLDSNDWAFGTDPFTIEMWVLQSAWTTWQLIAQRGSGSTTNVAWAIASLGSGSVELIARSSTTTVQFNTPTTDQRVLDNWQHVAVDRDAGGTYRIYVNGVMRASSAQPGHSIQNVAQAMTIGSDNTNSLNFVGYMDEIRITRGVARYATDGSFSVPNKRYPRNEAAPAWTVNPSIVSDSGYYGPGDIVRCDQGTHNLRKITYQWRKDGVAISGATGSSYTIQGGDVGSTITCAVTGRNYKGIVTQVSNGVAAVTPTYDTGALAPAGDMQSGSDRLIPAGDMQSGSDVLLWKERLT